MVVRRQVQLSVAKEEVLELRGSRFGEEEEDRRGWGAQVLVVQRVHAVRRKQGGRHARAGESRAPMASLQGVAEGVVLHRGPERVLRVSREPVVA